MHYNTFMGICSWICYSILNHKSTDTRLIDHPCRAFTTTVNWEPRNGWLSVDGWAWRDGWRIRIIRFCWCRTLRWHAAGRVCVVVC